MFGITTNLKNSPNAAWAPPPKIDGSAGLTVPMPMPDDPVARRFSYSVHEPDESVLTVGFAHSSIPESAIEGLLFLLALLLLVIGTWRRLSRGVFDRQTWMFLGVGIALLATESAIWGVSIGEVVLVVLACVAIVVGVGLRALLSIRRGRPSGGEL